MAISWRQELRRSPRRSFRQPGPIRAISAGICHAFGRERRAQPGPGGGGTARGGGTGRKRCRAGLRLGAGARAACGAADRRASAGPADGGAEAPSWRCRTPSWTRWKRSCRRRRWRASATHRRRWRCWTASEPPRRLFWWLRPGLGVTMTCWTEETGMASITDVAKAFFEAAEAGKGWAACQGYCHPNATFSAQAEPLRIPRCCSNTPTGCRA